MMHPRTTCMAAITIALYLLGAAARPAGAQNVIPPPEDRLSPLSMARTELADGTYLKVTYSSPRKRNRVIFGDLVPYGELWRLGANEATEITTTGDISFGGRRLPAGTYALFAIPGEDEWTIVVNRALGQAGTGAYDEQDDLMRITVPVQRIPDMYEAFTIGFEDAAGGKNLEMVWDQTKVVIPIRPL